MAQDGDDGWWAKVRSHILFCAGAEILHGVFPVLDHVGQGVFGECYAGASEWGVKLRERSIGEVRSVKGFHYRYLDVTEH